MIKFFVLSFFILLSFQSFAQLSEIKGKVENKNNKEKLAGAFVNCSGNGHSYNATTDADGEFKFKNLPLGAYDIKIDYVGFTPYQTHIELSDKKEELKVQLNNGGKNLNSV